MKDKVQKIREEVERLKSQLIRGACSSQIAMETRCKEEAYNEVLSILDSLQEEPVSDIDFEQELYKYFGQVKDFTLGMQIAKRFYEIGKQHQEPVSEDFEKIVEEIAEPTILNAYGTKELARRLRNTICGTSVSEDLEKAAIKYAQDKYMPVQTSQAFKAGAQWQKEKDESCSKDFGDYISELSKQFPEVSFAKLSRIAVRVAKWKKANLWKPADGDDLPEIDREVIVLIKYNAQHNIHDEEYPTYRVGFGHRPDPKGWDGKNIDTNEVTHYTPKLYDKGGWNAPDIAYWLDVKLPKEIEL